MSIDNFGIEAEVKGKNMVKNKIKTTWLALVFAGLVGSNVVNAEEQAVGFNQMLEKTITANPEVQARYHRLMEAGFEKEVARGGFLPKADIVGRYRKQEDISGNFSAQSRSGFAQPRMNAELVISQMLFDGFATSSEVKRLDHNKKSAYYDLQNAMQTTALEFTTAYLDMLRFTELAEMAKENYAIHKQLFSKIEERVNAGVARRVDLDQAAGRLALAEANLLVETTNLHDVTARMQRIYGDIPPDTLEKPTFYNNGVEPSVQDALKLAFAQNPDLLAKIEGIQASKDEVKLRKANYLPRFDLVGRKNLVHSDNGRFNDITADSVELTMNFNLFNGFSDQNLIKQTAAKLNTSEDLRDKACIDTRQTVVIAYNDIQQLKEQLKYRLTHKNSIESAKVAYDKQFDIGQRTLLDLLDTQNEYFQAKRTLTNTEYDLQNAFARTYAGQGELLKKVGVARDDVEDINRDDYLDKENVCKSIAPIQMQVDKGAVVAYAPAPVVPAQPLQPKKVVRECNVADVKNTVKDWASTASQKNVRNFLGFYSPEFAPADGVSKADWEANKRKEMRKKGKTQYSVSNIVASCNGDDAEATFDLTKKTTTYKLKKVSDTSCEVCNMKRIAIKGPTTTDKKQMNFKRTGNLWGITNESP